MAKFRIPHLCLFSMLLTFVLADSIRHNYNKDKLKYLDDRLNMTSTGVHPKSNNINNNWGERPRSRDRNRNKGGALSGLDTLLEADDDPDDWSEEDLFEDVESELEQEPLLGAKTRHVGRGGVTMATAASEEDWQRQVTGMLRGLSEGITALKHTMINLKLQNHLLYKQIKRWQNKCSDGGVQDTRPAIETAALTLDQDSLPSCPRDFFLRKDTNMCYRFSSERITWRMARERCRAQDADLVSIDNTDTQQWINAYARSHAGVRHCDFWTGGNDKNSEGQWHWTRTDRLFSYNNWNHDEPNNSRGDEHCMQMLWVFAWRWNDARCNYDNACFICEKPLRGKRSRNRLA